MPQNDNCVNNNFKLCFKLEQHTPIIHFQYDHKGATLRASELKPKLDKFLRKVLNLTVEIVENNETIEVLKEECKSLFIGQGKEHLALDYKIKIDENHNRYDKYAKNLKNYFGNQGNGAKKFSKNSSDIFKITIHSFYSELLIGIKENFASFLAKTNFGTRQSKGYGSFYLVEESEGYKPIEDVLDRGNYYLKVETTDSTEIDEVIKFFWSRLKSGINLNFAGQEHNCENPYYPPFLREYFYSEERDPPLTWDKRWVKEKFFGLDPNNIQNHVFARALLGLGTTFNYKKTTEPCNPNTLKLPPERDCVIEATHPTIMRIKSPVTFKPIIKDDIAKIYLLLDQDMIDLALSVVSIENSEETIPFNFIIKLARGGKTYPQKDNHDKEKYFIPNHLYDENDEFFDNFWNVALQNNGHYLGTPIELSLWLPRDFDLESLIDQYIQKLTNSFKVEYPSRGAIQVIDDIEIKTIGEES